MTRRERNLRRSRLYWMSAFSIAVKEMNIYKRALRRIAKDHGGESHADACVKRWSIACRALARGRRKK